MALLRKKPTEIPADAVILSEQDALKYQINILNKWDKLSDVWAYKFGGTILSALSTLSAVYINNHYRMKLKLFKHGYVSSYFPICVLPALMSFVVHAEFVLSDVVLQKDCPACLEFRASALQASLGCVLPAILAPLSAYSLVMRYATYDMPYVSQEPFKVYQTWRKHTKPIGNVLFAIFVGHALAASAITYFEAKCVQKVNIKLIQQEKEFENNLNS